MKTVFDPAEIAQQYENQQVLHVYRFNRCRFSKVPMKNIQIARSHCCLPALRKDGFLIDPYGVIEARDFTCGLYSLIVACLSINNPRRNV